MDDAQDGPGNDVRRGGDATSHSVGHVREPGPNGVAPDCIHLLDHLYDGRARRYLDRAFIDIDADTASQRLMRNRGVGGGATGCRRACRWAKSASFSLTPVRSTANRSSAEEAPPPTGIRSPS